MKKKKEIKTILEFNDRNYSKEETAFFYQRFFNILAEAANIKNVPQNIGKAVAEGILGKEKQL